MDSCSEYNLDDRPRNGDEQSTSAEAHDEQIGTTEARRPTTGRWRLTRRQAHATDLEGDG